MLRTLTPPPTGLVTTMPNTKLSLLICTRDGSRTIERAIRAIIAQGRNSLEEYEIVVVDNNSSDNTLEIARATLSSSSVSFQILQEGKPGKIYAFLAGVAACRGDAITIIDDDNVIGDGFISVVTDLLASYPKVAMIGSHNSLALPSTSHVPEWFEWMRGRYGCGQPYLNEVVHKTETTTIARTGVIAGAGSTFRKQPLIDCLNSGYTFYNDTQRGSGMSVTGEDLELCWLFRSMGLLFAYDARLLLSHLVNPDRLTIPAAYRLSRTIGAGALGTDPFIFTPPPNEVRTLTRLRHTWQWQLLSKLKRYLSLWARSPFPSHFLQENSWRSAIARTECWGAIARIARERGRYTAHINQVTDGEWTRYRVR
ncbi:glycosyltransferase [Rubinisphaera sp. JC750]|uniref:glycosyltransferase n=1 Tax=Rubinisphaera sp. JC750 TaxID=2898658 RepID=UPI001F1C8B29|nr:glycosyltransferase [Rubinisphaera sp. JC750]